MELSKQVDLVVIGNLLIDELPGPLVEPGGAALYSSLAATRSGLRVGLHSVVGTDYPVQPLIDADVKLSLHRLDGPGGRTVIRYTERGRALTHAGPGHEVMTPQTAQPFEASLVLLCPMPWTWQMYHLDRCLPGSAFLDPYPTLNEKRWRELEKRTDKLRYLVLNSEELEMDLSMIPESVPVIVKEGPRGGYCRLTGVRWEALNVAVVDPTGAGDSFIAGVASGLVQGLEWKHCLRRGAEIAAVVIQDIGARAFYGNTAR